MLNPERISPQTPAKSLRAMDSKPRDDYTKDWPGMVSGNGKYHTDKKGETYDAITLPEIQAMVDSPPSVNKSQARWIIPSTLPTRVFKEQETNGEFWLLWADLDSNPPALDRLENVIVEIAAGADYEIYLSRSSTEDKPKSRVLIPLSKPLCGHDWIICQRAFNGLLLQHGIEPDTANERAGQSCYLPNRGAFYGSRSRRTGIGFDPMVAWAAEIEAIRAADKAAELEWAAKRQAAAQRRATQSFDGNDLISAFNSAFEVSEILLRAGYDQRGSRFRHPQSQSGSFSASVKDGRVHSLSGSDPLFNKAGAHDAFSAFAVLFHGGDRRAALIAAGNDWLTVGGESWNTARQREYAQADNPDQGAFTWRARYPVGKVFMLGGVYKRITDLDELNQRFGQLQAEGRAVCVIHVPDALPITPQDFRARVAGEIVLVGIDKNGGPAFDSAEKFWLGNARKRLFTEVVFTSRPVKEDQYNLFHGFGIKPNSSGDCRLILHHIREVICAGDEAAFEAFLNLLAWQLQNIGKPSRIIVALFSEQQQSGKGILLEHVLLPIFGHAGYMTCDQTHGLDRFNDKLRGCSYLFMDEAAFARDRKLADKLKSLCQAQTLSIEAKGMPIITLPSGLNIYLATNHREIAHVETSDARFWILPVAEHRAGDHDYFAALGNEIEHGGREAFLGLLLGRDVSGFIPQRDIPRNNAALAWAKAYSRNVVDVTCWLAECLEEGLLLGVRPEFAQCGDYAPISWRGGEKRHSSDLREGYQKWARDKVAGFKQETALQDFWKTLTIVGFVAVTEDNARKRWIPPPDTAKTALERVISGEIR